MRPRFFTPSRERAARKVRVIRFVGLRSLGTADREGSAAARIELIGLRPRPRPRGAAPEQKATKKRRGDRKGS